MQKLNELHIINYSW